MKYQFVLLLILLLIIGCTKQFIVEPEKFDVKYYAKYSSSAGTRILDITYTVENGEIISCQGTYTTDMTDGKNVKECNLEALTAKDYTVYNVPLELITTIPEDQKMSGEVRQGPGSYKWEIIK